ncbi:hypothetical protein ACFRNT_10910 [Streptomyces sp. NPDC056697]|uniref:hypothetical protein n=1 Tax=Streptomyces sp. NPDC056697 TaxID=3345915 RepID=UPI0036B4EB37
MLVRRPGELDSVSAVRQPLLWVSTDALRAEPQMSATLPGGDVLRERAAAVPLIRQLAGPAD